MRHLDCAPGQALFKRLLAAEVPIRCGCNGFGGCGLCLVRVLAGSAEAPTPLETLHLDEAQRATGVRLACQLVPCGDLEVEILSTAARPAWRYLRRDETMPRQVQSAAARPVATGSDPDGRLGVALLLEQAGLTAASLGRLCVGGTFGQGLDIANAQAIGLLPRVPAARVELCGNTALAGARALLLAPESSARLTAIRARARIINLAQVPDFDERFLDQLYLRPSDGAAR